MGNLTNLPDRVDRARGRLGVDDREVLDARIGVQRLPDLLRVDRLVVGHADLDRLAAKALDEVFEPLAEDARDEVEHLVAGPDQAGRGRLQPKQRFALHDHDVVLSPEDLLEHLGGMGEEFDEGGIVVVHHRPGHVPQCALAHLDRSGRHVEFRPPHNCSFLHVTSSP